MSEGLMWLIGAVVCLLAASRVQLFGCARNRWPHNALRYHKLMPISCFHLRDSKALLTISSTVPFRHYKRKACPKIQQDIFRHPNTIRQNANKRRCRPSSAMICGRPPTAICTQPLHCATLTLTINLSLTFDLLN